VTQPGSAQHEVKDASENGKEQYGDDPGDLGGGTVAAGGDHDHHRCAQAGKQYVEEGKEPAEPPDHEDQGTQLGYDGQASDDCPMEQEGENFLHQLDTSRLLCADIP